MVCTVLAVQGAALQWQMGSAGTPMLLRLFFLFMAGMLFLPLVLLGLADQWMDFRKLEIDDQQNDHDTGGNDDDSASDADNESS
jgi:hypothetical protein